jgi:hypothetical protein
MPMTDLSCFRVAAPRGHAGFIGGQLLVLFAPIQKVNRPKGTVSLLHSHHHAFCRYDVDVTSGNGSRRTQKRRLGDFVKVPLGDGSHAYGRVLSDAFFAFYDLRTSEELPIEEIATRPVLFYAAVMDYAVKRGRWVVVGNLPLPPNLLYAPPRFIQDPLRKDSFAIYEKGEIQAATKQECLGLERAAVWNPEHVEERIRDHYAGNRNKWLDSLRMLD